MTSISTDPRGLLVSCPKCGQRNRLAYDRLGQVFRCGKCHTDLPAPNEPIEIQSDGIFDLLVGYSALPVLVDFWAPWCGPCKMVAPHIQQVAAELAGRSLVVKVNTEEVPALARKFRITAIPTMTVLKGGIEVARQAGAIPAPAIREFLKPWLTHGKA